VNTSKVISVSINYRLGALGFAISGTTGSYDANLGIQDQRLALQFVQDNIAAFGGDPTRVTLFGQSAGATSTGIHLTNQESWNYFSQVIIESLPLGLVLPPLELSLSLSRRFSEDLGCGKDLSQLQSCIQTKNLIEILTAQKTAQDKISAISPLFIFMPWQPAVDGVVVTDDILGSVYKGNFKQVPAMWGTVEQEGIMFVVEIWPNGLSAIEYEAIVRDIFRQNDAYKGVLELYPPSHAPGNGTLTSMANLATDYLFSCADLNMTQSMNQILGSNAPNYYFYRYDHVMSFYEAWGPNYTFCYDAVCHGAELPFVFHSATQAGYNWTNNELNLANQMSYYWGNFANTGDPNQGPTPVQVQWPEYDDSTMQNIVLAVPITTQTQEYSNFCTFWDTVGYQLP
jgi:carboxylesterase type B